MSRLKNKFFKIIASVLSACGITSTFTACYGMPSYVDELSGTVIGDLNEDGIVEKSEVISGIQVLADGEFITKTVDDGYFAFLNKGNYPVISFVDEDSVWQNETNVEYKGPGAYYILKKNNKN